MKKILLFFLLCGAVLLLPACTAEKKVTITVGPPSSQTEALPSEGMTEITIPKFAAELADVDVLAKAAAMGISGIQQNADGSYTYRMTPSEKAQIQASLKSTLADYFETLKADWSFADKIEMNDQFDHVTIFSDAKRYNETRDRKIAASIYAPTVLYRVFAELDTTETFKLQFSVIDKDDLGVVATFSYPEPKAESSPTPGSTANPASAGSEDPSNTNLPNEESADAPDSEANTE